MNRFATSSENNKGRVYTSFQDYCNMHLYISKFGHFDHQIGYGKLPDMIMPANLCEDNSILDKYILDRRPKEYTQKSGLKRLNQNKNFFPCLLREIGEHEQMKMKEQDDADAME